MPRSKSSSSHSSSSSLSFWDHPIATIEEALSLRKQIERLQGQLGKTLGSTTSAISNVITGKGGGGKRKLSPATLRKMRAAQQARWAEIKGGNADGSSQPAGNAKSAASTGKKKGSGGMTPEQRARISATLKARWAAKRKNEAAASTGAERK